MSVKNVEGIVHFEIILVMF